MGWRDRLRKAQFRGVPFFVAGAEATLGRRVQVHEFPLRDVPVAEDLGRRTRAFSIDAFVLGDDYMAARDALIRACEQAGPGPLVHPYLGELQGTVTEVKLRESTAEGGVARLTLQFVESGQALFPATVSSTVAGVNLSADTVVALVRADFMLRHAVVRKPQFLADSARGIFGQALAGIRAAAGQIRGVATQVAALNRDLEAAKRDVITMIYEPASAAQALAGNLQQLLRNVTNTPREVLSLARTFYSFGSLLPPVQPTNTVSRRQQAANQAEMVRLVRLTALAEGARGAAATDFESYEEAAAVRDELVATAQAAMLDVDLADETFNALRTLQAAVVHDLAARGADLARLVRWTPRITMPALVAAHRIYADATREADLLTRNRVQHPLFVPGAQPLEALSDAA